MASIQQRGDNFQLRVKNKLLPRPFFKSFPTREAAAEFGGLLESLLARGIVPANLMSQEPASPLLNSVIDLYVSGAPVTDSDRALLGVIGREVVGVRVQDVNVIWAEGYVRRRKTEENLAPGTIRKRVGSLGRVLDWHLVRTVGSNASNPFRMLPVGYSAYARGAKGAKVDVHRNRRLTALEEAAVRQALGGEKREDRERALRVDPSMALLFDLILDTGLRLKEAYRMRWDQVDLSKRVLRVEGSKGHRGKLKPRVVPLKAGLVAKFSQFANPEFMPSGLLFPYWDGTYNGEYRATSKLSARFAKLFEYAGIDDFIEHDLRHEACCRWVEMRDEAGRWRFSDVEVCLIMGWSNYSMILRYASLRGEDLASRLV